MRGAHVSRARLGGTGRATRLTRCALDRLRGRPAVCGLYTVADPDYSRGGEGTDLRPTEPYRRWGWPALRPRTRTPRIAVPFATFASHVRRWFVAGRKLGERDLRRMHRLCLEQLDDPVLRGIKDATWWPRGTAWGEAHLDAARGRPALDALDCITLYLHCMPPIGQPALRLRPHCPPPFRGRWGFAEGGARRWHLRRDGRLRTRDDPDRDRIDWCVLAVVLGETRSCLALRGCSERWYVRSASRDAVELAEPGRPESSVRLVRLGGA